MFSTVVVFGLGNPGARYSWTRHNLGFHVLDQLATSHGLKWSRGARSYQYAEHCIGSTQLFLVKPLTYVNRAGVGLCDFRARYNVAPDELVVVVDDIALPFGQLRLRRRGSHGGHNGLRSLIGELDSTDFPRLRLGVGPVPSQEDPADYVLEPFLSKQRRGVEQFIRRAANCVEDLLDKGFDRTMNLYNASEADAESD